VTTTEAAASVPQCVIRRIVELAIRAPSVHNTQPWRWRITDGALELHADRARQLAAGDPHGRNLMISCGATMQHAEAAAKALGWRTTIDRLPGGPVSTLVARLWLSPRSVPRDAQATIDAIERRYTDRRRFTAWPVPQERLGHLAAVATQWGTRGLAIVDVTERVRLELLVARALERQSTDRAIVSEQASWVDRKKADGILSAVLPSADQLLARCPNRFGVGLLDDSDQDIEGHDGLIVLCGPADEPLDWLRAGEGLSALWLAATAEGLSVVPLSQVIEVDETRETLRHDVLGGLAHPLILLRVGWQAISRGELPRTARRPVDDVLDPRDQRPADAGPDAVDATRTDP
jgi:nitroreductase